MTDEPDADEMTLADLPVGCPAVVCRVLCAGPVAVRLMEMGVLPGTRVVVRRIAPLGDPMEIWLRDYSLSIRRTEASRIIVATG